MGWAEFLETLDAREPIPEGPIPIGQRNAILTRIAGRFRRPGFGEAAILAALREENKRCEIPLPDDELRTIAHSVARYEPEPPHLRIAASNGTHPAETLVAEPEREWPEPLAEAAYHGVLGELVRAVEGETEADPAGLLGGLLVHTAALAGPRRTMHQGSWQAARLYIVIVGETAVSRKGTTGSVVSDIFRLVDPEYHRLLVPGLGSGEGLVGHMKRLRAEDGTEQRALITESELGRLLAVMNREGSTLSHILRDAWDGSPLGRTLARDEMIVHEHHVCLFAHITRDELRRKLTSTDAANGFANRFLWLAVRRPRLVPIPERVDRLVRGIWRPLALALEHAQAESVLRWTPAADGAWREFYTERAKRPRVGLLGAMTARVEAQVARLALTYALADGADAVDLAHLEAGVAVWDYAERSARHIFGSSTGNRHADVLLGWLRQGEGIPWSRAKDALGLRLAADMTEVVAVLSGAGLAETVEGDVPAGGGRRPVIIRAMGANPANHAGAAQERERESAT